MISDKPCHLLALPRELRDAIYSELHHEVALTRDRKGHSTGFAMPELVMLKKAPLVSLLCTCKQINHEYSKIVYERAHLALYPVDLKKMMQAIEHNDGIPETIFKHVREITMVLCYSILIVDRLYDEFRESMRAHADAVRSAKDFGQEALEATRRRHWTPTKQTRIYLRHILEELNKTFSDEVVSLRVHIHISKFQAGDFEWVELGNLQLNDLDDLHNCPDTPYARKGRLEFFFQFMTPFFSQILDSTSADIGDRRTRGDSTFYRTKDSDEEGGWLW